MSSRLLLRWLASPLINALIIVRLDPKTILSMARTPPVLCGLLKTSRAVCCTCSTGYFLIVLGGTLIICLGIAVRLLVGTLRRFGSQEERAGSDKRSTCPINQRPDFHFQSPNEGKHEEHHAVKPTPDPA